MAGEVAGLARDFRSLEEVVSNAVAILDRVNRTEMAPISLASTYHKLSHVYMKVTVCALTVTFFASFSCAASFHSVSVADVGPRAADHAQVR